MLPSPKLREAATTRTTESRPSISQLRITVKEEHGGLETMSPISTSSNLNIQETAGLWQTDSVDFTGGKTERHSGYRNTPTPNVAVSRDRDIYFPHREGLKVLKPEVELTDPN